MENKSRPLRLTCIDNTRLSHLSHHPVRERINVSEGARVLLKSGGFRKEGVSRVRCCLPCSCHGWLRVMGGKECERSLKTSEQPRSDYHHTILSLHCPWESLMPGHLVLGAERVHPLPELSTAGLAEGIACQPQHDKNKTKQNWDAMGS